MDALELGEMADRDRLPVYIAIYTPSGVDPEGWKEYWDEGDEICDRADLSASSPTTNSPEPLFVTRKIFRRGAGAAAIGGAPRVSHICHCGHSDDSDRSGAFCVVLSHRHLSGRIIGEREHLERSEGGR